MSIKLGWLEATGGGALGIGAIVVLVAMVVFVEYFMCGELSRLLKRRDLL